MTAFFTPDGNQEDNTTNISQPGSSSSATSDKYIHIQPHELILETSELVPEPEHLVSPVSKVLEYEEATTSNSDPKQDLLNFKDPALWQDSHNYAEMILEKWVEQNLTDMDFSMSKRNFGEQHRYAGKQIFYKRLVNGEVVRRDWAIYSESTGNILCLYCVLFGNKKPI
ncbi:zinc finger MYM-type protein 5-like [Diabrotica virgifera virgifera]|nr:zinc finger MYM-type protein 5-like [Diabrotica virgifera virgifera]